MTEPDSSADVGFNPYESPRAIGPPIALAAESHFVYRSAHTLAMWAIALLSLMALLESIGVINDFLQYQMLSAASRGIRYTREAAVANNLRVSVTSQTATVASIATAVLFVMWMYRAYKNLPALGATHLEHSPGMAVGWWFVPFVNFVKPCTVVLEIWRHSDPAGDGRGERPTSAAWVGFWWCAFLMRGFGAAAIRMGTAGLTHTLAASLTKTVWYGVYHAVSATAAVLAILVIRRIGAMQDARFEALQNPIPVAEAV